MKQIPHEDTLAFLDATSRLKGEMQTTRDTVADLFQRLPCSFHPAIVRACCVAPDDTRSLIVDVDSCRFCDEVVQRPPPCDVARVPGDGRARGAGCACPAPADALLAAAALLCGVQSEDPSPDPKHGACPAPGAPVPVAHCNVTPQPLLERVAVPCGAASAHACPQERQVQASEAAACSGSCEWVLPSGGFTRLELCLWRTHDVRSGAPWWGPGLAQLRTLRSVCIYVDAYFAVDDLLGAAAALRCMPALHTLELVCNESITDLDKEYCHHLTDIASFSSRRLLVNISALHRLSTLHLDRCFSFVGKWPWSNRTDSAPETELSIAQLSRLSSLTQLRLDTEVQCNRYMSQFVYAVKQLPRLRHLRVRADVRLWGAARDVQASASAMGEALLAELVRGPGMPVLQHLDCSMIKPVLVWGSPVVRMNEVEGMHVSKMHAAMRSNNPALLSRLTALCFGGREVPYPKAAAAALVADMPSLQDLDLRNASSCMPATASSQRPEYADFTRRNAAGALVPRVGVLDILHGLLAPGAAGPRCLRRLDISRNADLDAESAGELASLLRQLSHLEELNMSGLSLGVTGVQAVAEALAALPQLRSLDARDTVEERNRWRLPVVFADLQARLAELQYWCGSRPLHAWCSAKLLIHTQAYRGICMFCRILALRTSLSRHLPNPVCPPM